MCHSEWSVTKTICISGWAGQLYPSAIDSECRIDGGLLFSRVLHLLDDGLLKPPERQCQRAHTLRRLSWSLIDGMYVGRPSYILQIVEPVVNDDFVPIWKHVLESPPFRVVHYCWSTAFRIRKRWSSRWTRDSGKESPEHGAGLQYSSRRY